MLDKLTIQSNPKGHASERAFSVCDLCAVESVSVGWDAAGGCVGKMVGGQLLFAEMRGSGGSDFGFPLYESHSISETLPGKYTYDVLSCFATISAS